MGESAQPGYRNGMSSAELEQFRTLRDVVINARLSTAMDALEARRATGEVLPTDLANPLGQTAKVAGIIGSPRDGGARAHLGLDLIPADGTHRSAIHAMAAGTILYIGVYSKNAGNTVVMLDDTGRIHYYMHLADGSTSALQPGARVVQGEIIAQMGNTGISYGAHLHVAVKVPLDSEEYAKHKSILLERLKNAVDEESGEPLTATLYPGLVLKPGHHLAQYGIIDPPIEGMGVAARGQMVPFTPRPQAPVPTIAPGLPANVTGGVPACIADSLPCPMGLGKMTSLPLVPR